MAVNVKNEIKSFRAKLADALYESALEVFADTPNPKHPSSNLGDSHLAETFKVERDKKSFVFFIQDYYIYIESGRKKGSKAPPYDAIFHWVQKNNIRFRDKRGRFITFRATTFIIMKAIKRDGIAPRPFVDRIVESAQEKALDFVSVLLVDELFDRIIINELEKIK
ncbi:hypothetical protein N9251_03415 [Gammaproteobacteria bacterium]|nr:hypothetical protein [Gammaproteobacteria bacterium]